MEPVRRIWLSRSLCVCDDRRRLERTFLRPLMVWSGIAGDPCGEIWVATAAIESHQESVVGEDCGEDAELQGWQC